ncbi:MAG: PaaI family thioesterase, partial [Anaerovoracaceae bacterium]
WEANRVGGLHGGIMASMLDHACGLTATAWLGHWAPTMSINIDYIRPAEIGDHLLAAATVVSLGRRLIRMRGELRSEETGKVVAACSATFFNKED